MQNFNKKKIEMEDYYSFLKTIMIEVDFDIFFYVILRMLIQIYLL